MSDSDQDKSVAAAKFRYNELLDKLNIPPEDRLAFEEAFNPISNHKSVLAELAYSDEINNSYYQCVLYNIYREHGSPSHKLFANGANVFIQRQIIREEAHAKILALWEKKEYYQHLARKSRHAENKGYAEKIDYDRALLDNIKQELYKISQGSASGQSAEQLFRWGVIYFECKESLTREAGEKAGEIARVFLEEASRLGYNEANYYLGLVYTRGLYDIEEDEQKGRVYLQEGAYKGDARAKFYLATLDIKSGLRSKAIESLTSLSQESFSISLNSREDALHYEHRAYVIAIAKLFCAQNFLDQHGDVNNRIASALRLSEEVLDFSKVMDQFLPPWSYTGGSRSNFDPDWNVIAGFASSRINDANHIRELEHREAEKRKAVEDTMAMVSHQFRGEITTILYNAEHENEKSRYIKTAKTMSSLIDLAGILSTKPGLLKEEFHNDSFGKGRLYTIFWLSLRDLMLDLTDSRNRERMSPYFLYYAKEQGVAPKDLTLASWANEIDWQAYELNIQRQLQSECAEFSEDAREELARWLELRFLPIRTFGLSESGLEFEPNGIKASVLRVFMTEILKNAIRFSPPSSQEAIVLNWSENESNVVLECTNPSTRASRSRAKSKGGGRGHGFLSHIAYNLNGRFEQNLYPDGGVDYYRSLVRIILPKA